MENFRQIINWIYPLMNIIILIISLTKLNTKSGVFFSIGFGITAFNTIIWRLIAFLPDLIDIPILDIYKYYEIISLLFYFSSSILIILGISNLGNSKSETLDSGIV